MLITNIKNEIAKNPEFPGMYLGTVLDTSETPNHGELAYNRLKKVLCTLSKKNYVVEDENVIHGGTGKPLVNSSFCAGNEIFVGDYDCVWNKVISLAHEIGHSERNFDIVNTFIESSKEKDRAEHHVLVLETLCWQYAFDLLELLNIIVPDSAVEYAGKQLATYASYKG